LQGQLSEGVECSEDMPIGAEARFTGLREGQPEVCARDMHEGKVIPDGQSGRTLF